MGNCIPRISVIKFAKPSYRTSERQAALAALAAGGIGNVAWTRREYSVDALSQVRLASVRSSKMHQKSPVSNIAV